MPDGRHPQPDLFGSNDTDADFATVLCGLAAIPGLGRVGIAALARAAGGQLGRLWHISPATLEATLVEARTPRSAAILLALMDREQVLNQGADHQTQLAQRSVTVMASHELPFSLRSLPTPPPWLFVQGNPGVLLHRPAVAVVGTRSATEAGLQATRRAIQLLEGYAVTVVSGLAEGIDDEAHRASLGGRLRNVAFLGHGIDITFPQSTRGTRERIVAQGGAVAAEYLPGEMYQRSSFVQRNRLQAGLADLVIAVEAQAKSGTAHTVEFALGYRKPVVGIRVPGSTLTDEIERAGQLVVDLSEQRGYRALDSRLQRLIIEVGGKPDPFAPTLEKLRRDLKIRNMTPSALDGLAADLYKAVMDERERLRMSGPGTSDPPTKLNRKKAGRHD